MNKLTGPDVLIKVDIVEGRGFDLEEGELLLVRGLIQDQSLTAELPDAHMVWETDKSSLRRLRSANVPVRLDVFRIRCEETSGTRIGQLLLNLKEAPFNESWKKLIRVNESGETKELCVSVNFDNFQNKNEETDGELKPRLREECGFYEIGPDDGSQKDFRVNILIQSISNIDQLASPNVHLVTLIYQILGEQIETEPKVLGSGDDERTLLPIGDTVYISLRASPRSLQSFLAEIPLMHVQLWEKGEDRALVRQLAETSVLIGNQPECPWQVTLTPILANNDNCRLVVEACLEQQEPSAPMPPHAWTYRQLHLHHLVLHQAPPNKKCFLTVAQAGTPIFNRIVVDVKSPNEVSTLGYKVRLEPGEIPELTLNSEDGKTLARTSLSQVTDSGISTATLVETSSGLAAGVLSFETDKDFDTNSSSDEGSLSEISYTSVSEWKSDFNLQKPSFCKLDNSISMPYSISSNSHILSSQMNNHQFSVQPKIPQNLDFFFNDTNSLNQNIKENDETFLDPVLTSKLRRACEQSIALVYLLQQNTMRYRVQLKLLSEREKQLNLVSSEHINASDLELRMEAALDELNDIKYQVNNGLHLWKRQTSLAMIENQQLRQELEEKSKELEELRKVSLTGKHFIDILNTMKLLEIRLDSAMKAKHFFKEQFHRSSEEVFELRKTQSMARDITLQLDKEENEAIANYYKIRKYIQNMEEQGGNEVEEASIEGYKSLENIRIHLHSIISRRGELLRIPATNMPDNLIDVFADAKHYLANAVLERHHKRILELRKDLDTILAPIKTGE